MISGSHPLRSHVAFTLVEVLVVLMIISIMGGMVVTAVRGVTDTARLSRTRSIIAAVDSVIQEHYESFKYRPLPVSIPSLSMPAGTDVELGLEVLANEAARVRLNMTRELQRMELPDRYTDLENGPVDIFAACNVVKLDTSTGKIVGTRNDPTSRKSSQVNTNESGKRFGYLERVVPGRTTEHQGAECLYLIMATSYVGGEPAISTIPASNIGDTDEDGMLEILDGWGQPLGFLRWPVGYADPNEMIDVTVVDDFDLFRVDFAHVIAKETQPSPLPSPSASAVVGAVDVNSGTEYVLPWAMRPLIVSAGSDGKFGIALDPIDSSGNPSPNYSYVAATWNWPINSSNMGSEAGGRSGSYRFPDPYMRRFIAANDPTVITTSGTDRRLVGQDLNASDNSDRADNVTNYSSQVK